MSKNLMLIIVIILLLIIIIGIVIGIFVFSKNPGEKSAKKIETFTTSLDDLYCNIKDSKKILKVRITIETINEKTYNSLEEKHFLIRDEANKIIRDLTEEDLHGEEGQTNLQKMIKEKLIELFQDENITNIYFDDFIIQ